MAQKKAVHVTPVDFQIAEFEIQGTAPYVQKRWGSKVKHMLREKHEQGSTAAKDRTREARDFDAEYEDCYYLTADGKHGIPAQAFRDAAISACRLVNYTMTRAKLSLFAEADGWDVREAQPLVFFTEGEPHKIESMTLTATKTPNISVRAMWNPGWRASVRMRYDAGQFRLDDVANLIDRIGKQVGIGEGRADSKKSNGCGWGFFEIVS